jgi:hypothetical protein
MLCRGERGCAGAAGALVLSHSLRRVEARYPLLAMLTTKVCGVWSV